MKPLIFRGIPVAVSADIEKLFPYFNSPNAPALFKYLREHPSGQLAISPGETAIHFTNNKQGNEGIPLKNPG